MIIVQDVSIIPAANGLSYRDLCLAEVLNHLILLIKENAYKIKYLDIFSFLDESIKHALVHTKNLLTSNNLIGNH